MRWSAEMGKYKYSRYSVMTITETPSGLTVMDACGLFRSVPACRSASSMEWVVDRVVHIPFYPRRPKYRLLTLRIVPQQAPVFSALFTLNTGRYIRVCDIHLVFARYIFGTSY